MDQIRHTNATMEKEEDLFRGQTESADIRIVTPMFKIQEKPGADVKVGANASDLNTKFEEANSDYKAERMAEQYRLRIIDPKVTSHAFIPAHGPRDWERKRLTDFPSLHGKRSFLDLDALEQLKIRKSKPVASDFSYARIPDAKPWKTPASAMKDDDGLRELDRLRNNLDNLQKARPIPKVEKAVVSTDFRPLPQRREIVEVKQEVIAKPKAQKVHRIEEKKRTEEVERRIIRRERRHKSHRTYKSSGSRQGRQEHHDWHGTNGYRSGSRGYGHINGFQSELHLPITYDGSRRLDSSSDRFFKESRSGSGLEDRGYGSLSDSLRRGELKYGVNGDLKGDVNIKANRVHKSHSTRDVFYKDGREGDRFSTLSRRDPTVQYPPTLPRNGFAYDSPPRSQMDDYRGGLVKARSYTDWDNRYRGEDDMAKLESEFRDARLMRLPDGKVNEREYRHQEIPGGYETYEREVKADSGRRINPEGLPTDFSEASHDYHFKRETQK